VKIPHLKIVDMILKFM